MIVPMRKLFLVTRSRDRDRLLASLAELGVVHLKPVDPTRALPDEKTVAQIRDLERAVQVLSETEPKDPAPDLTPIEAAQEVLALQQRSAERRSRLTALNRQLHEIAVWGNLRLEQIEALRSAGINPRFYSVPSEDLTAVQAELVQVLAPLPGKRSLIGVIHRPGDPELPESAEEFPLPQQDAPAIRAEAAELDAAGKQDARRLAQLAHLKLRMEKTLRELRGKLNFDVARRSTLDHEHFCGLQGWVPADVADSLTGRLADAGLDVAAEILEPAPDEQPPTLIRYPRWARPIKGLFDILNTLPAPHELDLSAFFMVALPVFAAILIGDGGYGALFTIAALVMRRRLIAIAGREKADLILVVGVVSLTWGILTANFFGISPDLLIAKGGAWARFGRAMAVPALLWRENGEQGRELLIKVSFIIGCIHLVLAHLRRCLAFWPAQNSWAEIGWCLILLAMQGVIWILFFGSAPAPTNLVLASLVVGFALAVLFSVPSPNPLKRVGIGLASSLLPLIGAFGDTMSYIRLMAVGLASAYIAIAFNSLGATLAESATWFVAAPVIVAGHLLNIALALIAIFAHGVRLNMLEFSNNAGVQWAGYAYAPFEKSHIKEC